MIRPHIRKEDGLWKAFHRNISPRPFAIHRSFTILCHHLRDRYFLRLQVEAAHDAQRKIKAEVWAAVMNKA